MFAKVVLLEMADGSLVSEPHRCHGVGLCFDGTFEEKFDRSGTVLVPRRIVSTKLASKPACDGHASWRKFKTRSRSCQRTLDDGVPVCTAHGDTTPISRGA